MSSDQFTPVGCSILGIILSQSNRIPINQPVPLWIGHSENRLLPWEPLTNANLRARDLRDHDWQATGRNGIFGAVRFIWIFHDFSYGFTLP